MGILFIVIALISTALLGTSAPFNKNLTDPNTQPPTEFLNQEASCMPSINTNRMIKVRVRDQIKELYRNNIKHPEFNKEDDEWVLVKENAPIPAWKVALEARFELQRDGDKGTNKYFAEMEHLGTAIGINGNPDNGKDVYIGIGWCDPKTGAGSTHGNFENIAGKKEPCLDPLVQDVVYVVTHQGITLDEYSNDTSGEVQCDEQNRHAWQGCHDWGTYVRDNPPHTQENMDKYWWKFNVYYKASKLPANPTNDDLPCWMKLACPQGGDVWGEKRYNTSRQPNCEVSNILPTPIADNQKEENTTSNIASILNPFYKNKISSVFAGSIDPNRPRLIINKSFMQGVPDTVDGITIAKEYISSQKLSSPPGGTDKKIGTAYNNHFDVYLRKGLISGTPADHAIILDPAPLGYSGPYWLYVPILKDSKPIANSLQLGSFVPGIPSYFYEWWTPSCKPALYLYPQRKTTLSVSVIPDGYITKSIPPITNTGWVVTAYPDGMLFDEKSLKPIPSGYLYYEANVRNISIPKDTGWIQSSRELPLFFANTLRTIGFTKKEIKDFTAYWIPKLTKEGDKWFITLLDQKQVNTKEPVYFSITPDTFYRVRFYFEQITPTTILPALKPPKLIPIKRNGFTVIDWGGIMGNGTCGISEISQ